MILNELSGTAGGTSNLQQLRQRAADLKSQLASKQTKEKTKKSKQWQ